MNGMNKLVMKMQVFKLGTSYNFVIETEDVNNECRNLTISNIKTFGRFSIFLKATFSPSLNLFMTILE